MIGDEFVLIVVMVVEGVLRNSGTDAQFETGWALYQSLVPNSRLFLMSHEWTAPEMDVWLQRRHLTGHLDYLHCPIPGPAGRIDALARIKSWRVNLVIEPDPACAALELAEGWNTLLHTHAAYTRPEWRPDYQGTPRPWDQMVEGIEKNQLLHAADTRLREE